MGSSPEGRRSPGRLDILLPEGILKGAEAAHPLLKDEPVGKMTSLVEQRALAGTQERRVYDLWKKGQETQEDYKDALR